MSTELKRLEAIQSTLASEGWKHLVEDVETKVEAMKEEFLSPQVTLEMMRFAQGRIAVYREFLSLKTVVDQILEQNESVADEDATDG